MPEQQAAPASIGLNWDGDFNAVDKTGLGGQATGFFRFDAGKIGLSSMMLNIPQGSSGAMLYETGIVPEPTT